MALISCPECGKNVSTLAQFCPNCGYPMKNSRKVISLLVFFCVLTTSVATFASDTDTDPSIAQLQSQVQELKNENKRLKKEIIELRTQLGIEAETETEEELNLATGYLRSVVMVRDDDTQCTAEYVYDLKNKVITIDETDFDSYHEFFLPINGSSFTNENLIGIIGGLTGEVGFSCCPLLKEGIISELVVKYKNRTEVYQFNASDGHVNDYIMTVYKLTESNEQGEAVISIPVSYEYDVEGRLTEVKSIYDMNAYTAENEAEGLLPDCCASYSFNYDEQNKLVRYYLMKNGIYPGDIASNGEFEIDYHDDGKMEVIHDMDYDVSSTLYVFENSRLSEVRHKWGKDLDPVVNTYYYDESGYLCMVDFAGVYYELSYYGNGNNGTEGAADQNDSYMTEIDEEIFEETEERNTTETESEIETVSEIETEPEPVVIREEETDSIEITEETIERTNPYIGQVISLGNYETLQVGSEGEAVQKVQQELIAQGFLDGEADGIYGNGTAGGVTSFQESIGIAATGIADEETQGKLFGDSETSADDIEIIISGISETSYMRINGLFVDESYVDKDNENKTLLYVCYSTFTPDQNLRVDSKDSELTVNGINIYTSEHYGGSCRYLGSYYYSDYLEDVYVGDEIKVVETFKVPKGELEPGRELSFENSQIPDSDKIRLNTDDILHCDSVKTIAKIVDPEGYEDMSYKLSPADSDTVARVKNAINGYGWDFYVNYTSYHIDFYDNGYDLRTAFADTSGSYTITNGYIILTNGTTGAVNYAPYSWGPNDIELGITDAFDVSEN